MKRSKFEKRMNNFSIALIKASNQESKKGELTERDLKIISLGMEMIRYAIEMNREIEELKKEISKLKEQLGA